MVRFFAIGLNSVEASLSKIHGSIDDAAQLLGHKTFDRFRNVHLPLIRSGILTATLLVFVEVSLSKVEPLSVDLTMFPLLPTATNVLFPNPTPLKSFPVGEVALSQDAPLSFDLTMFPEAPTPTNKTETDDEELSDEEVVVSSSVVVLSEVVVEDELSL